MPATCEQIASAYRLSNDKFEATISFDATSPGITHLIERRTKLELKLSENPLTLRLATDAPRIDFIDWQFHSGSGEAVPPENDWGFQLELHKKPTSNGGGPRVQRITDTLLGPPWYTDIYYPGYCWYRRMVELPKAWEGKPIVFVLGGSDEFDWRDYWVYLNGERIGQHSYDTTYTSPFHEVPRYLIKPGDAHYGNLKFGGGEQNLLAIQARRLDRRAPEMHRLDLERYSGLSMLVDQYVAAGEPTRDVNGFLVGEHRSSVGDDGAAVVEMDLTHPSESISITARYWLAPNDVALHKRITVRNEGESPITLLEADVLNASIENVQYTGGGQGWPVRVGDDAFAGVAHPAGLATWDKKGLHLSVIPGATLDPTHSHDYISKTAVLGAGSSRRAFSEYLQSHGRRKPQFLNMYSLYGLCEIASGLYPNTELTQELVDKNLAQMRELQKRNIKFDYYCIDTGWNDPLGELKTFHPKNFPHGGEKALADIRDLGMKPLLWISPAQGPPAFRFGTKNPLLKDEDNIGAGWFLCVAAPRWRTMLREAMLHHVTNNGVRGFKLDEISFYCGRSNHGHLPNKYGIEAEMDAFIDTLDAVMKQCPDVLLMLYWRFTSPWWLLHVDTLYQRGLQMEGATPSPLPSRIMRQSVTVSLDQGHDWNWDTMPLIGQDSLGVWLSNTRWGSWMGAEGWREAWLMDFIRGNMMHQLWGDLSLLGEDDLKFMAAIAKWTGENSSLLKNPRRILGSPWKQEPYGYACCDDERGVIVINNAQFPADRVQIALDESIGLRFGTKYDITWIYKDGSIEARRLAATSLLDVELGSFEVCMADIRPAENSSANATTSTARPASRQRIHARFIATSSSHLDWSDPAASKRLALVMNGRSVPTNSPETLQAGPERTDERDRDIVAEDFAATAVLQPRHNPSKLLVITRFDRDGIAWHHLAPFEIVRITATSSGGEKLKMKVTPRKWHEQAGGWSWLLHEFELPRGASRIAIAVESVHPRTVHLTFELWHDDA